MVSRASSTSDRLSPRALRRRKLRQMAVAAAACLIILWSFGAGYLWRQFRARTATPPVAVVQATKQEKAEALRLLDEAVRARHEGRWQGAMNALMAARRTDPQAKGLDIFIAQTALEESDSETLRQATGRALELGGNDAPAKLLQAADIWTRRGEQGTAQAGEQACRYLGEAVEDRPSSAEAFFFLGELSQLLGNSAEAHRHIRAALHRQSPWRSSALLELKKQIAALEARDAGKPVTVVAPEAREQAVLDWGVALRFGAPATEAEEKVRTSMPQIQVLALLEDISFKRGGEAMPPVVQHGAGESIPYLRMNTQ